MRKPFYERGLRFACTRCSRCCRHTSGYVFLSPEDLRRLSAATGAAEAEVLRRWCRAVSPGGIPRVSLKEKENLDCVFWEEGGCSVYASRPIQCRSFPFWSSNLSSRSAWEAVAAECPGIGRGALHDAVQIERWLQARLEEGYL